MSKEVKIGVITVIAIALLYYGFNFLRGSDLFSPSNRYYVVYKNVSGLNVSNPIYINGLPVGRVSGFQLLQNRGEIVVSLDIDQYVTLSDSATATLANDGLLGGKAIILDLGRSENKLSPGDTLRSKTDKGIVGEFEPVADNLKTTVIKINELLDKLNASDLKGVVDTLKYSIGKITKKVDELDTKSTFDNLGELVTSFKARSAQLDTLLQNSNQMMDSLSLVQFGVISKNLNATLTKMDDIMGTIQAGEGTLGKMVKNDSVYNNLNKLLVDLDELMIHFNNYPKDFLRPLGRKNKKLKGVSQDGN